MLKHKIELNTVYENTTHIIPSNVGEKLAVAGSCKCLPAVVAGEEF